MSDLFLDWPNRWFGFFENPETGEISVEELKKWIDATWQPAELESLVRDLRSAPVALATAAGSEPCLLCSRKFPVGSFSSDGVWLWPSDLWHYVEAHGVRVPEPFAEHVRRSNYSPPAELDIDDRDLPFPP